ncbi:MAG: Holliday junction branch migration protein RuvA [Clostridia bacterium]|nr:Holliday junction branch migration protein RuvA [Clostridia bacterium]
MIAYLKGKIIKKNSSSLVVANNGVGYEVFVPLNNLYGFREGEEIELITYLHIREDLMQLYGFQNWQERDIFLLLINVSGVGPKGALTILSHISTEKLKQAICSEDVSVLTKLPGIGKKTAQRLIIELKDKLPAGIASYQEGELESAGSAVENDLLTALVSLGYQPTEVKKLIPQLLKEFPDKDEAFILRKALQILARL